MQLNRYIPDHELPAILRQPLVFGNLKQIDALNCLEIKINQLETKKAKKKDNPPTYFNVTIEYSGTAEIEILAVDAEDAEEQAEERFDLFDAEIKIDDISAIKTKNT